MYGLSCVVVAERQSHKDLSLLFGGILLIRGGFTLPAFRLNLTSKVCIDFLCVYLDRNKQQPQHSWTIAYVLAHFNVSLFLPDI